MPGGGRLAVILAAALPVLLGGVLTLDPDLDRRSPWCGAWVFPIGAEREWQAPTPAAEAYALLRGFGTKPARHMGADLGNGRAGGAVCAGACGIVVLAVDGRDRTDWGNRVVVAHRLPDGRTAYSVYAHLLPGSIRVHPGDRVGAGEPIARVGRSGNATTPHLHFEIRVARDRTQRWEKAAAVDPLAFVANRLVAARPALPVSTCSAWAEELAMIERGASPDEPLRRKRWWGMLAGAAGHESRRIPESADSLAASLREAGVLEEEAHGDPDGDPDGAPAWKEMARDLARLRERGHRLLPVPLSSDLLEDLLGDRLGHRVEISRLARRHPERPPRVSDAILLMAALAGPLPEPSASR